LKALVDWMNEEGKAGGLEQVDWETVDMNAVSQEQINTWEEVFAEFFSTKTKEELYTEGSKRGLMIFPVNNVQDILNDPQLRYRNFWIEVEHSELGTKIIYPGIPFKIGGFSYSLSRGPLIGEHNWEVYCGELGFSKAELDSLIEDKIV